MRFLIRVEQPKGGGISAAALLFGFREAIAKVAPLWYSHALFPFTLREREHHPQRIRQPQPLGVVATRTLVLPLPQGEGRGEGIEQ